MSDYTLRKSPEQIESERWDSMLSAPEKKPVAVAPKFTLETLLWFIDIAVGISVLVICLMSPTFWTITAGIAGLAVFIYLLPSFLLGAVCLIPLVGIIWVVKSIWYAV